MTRTFQADGTACAKFTKGESRDVWENLGEVGR